MATRRKFMNWIAASGAGLMGGRGVLNGRGRGASSAPGLAAAPASSGVVQQSYLPLPSGTPTAGDAPLATGSGEASTWGAVQNIPVVAPLPSGDTSGASDTAALNLALASLSPREALVLTVPGYYISAPLSIPSGCGLTSPIAYGVESTPHIKAAAGFSGPAMIANQGWLNGATSGEDGIEISNLFIDGSNGGNGGPFVSTNGHGIVLAASHCHVHHNYLLNISGAGVVFADSNSAGGPVTTGSTQENYCWDNKIQNPGSWCIWVQKTSGSIGMTDGVIARNIIIDPSYGGYYRTTGKNPQINGNLPYEAVRLDNGAGWWVTENHAYFCPGGAYFFSSMFGTHFRDNTCDMFGTFPWSVVSGTLTAAPIDGAALHGIKCNINPTGSGTNYQHPSVATGNLLNAFEGYNKAGTIAPATGTASNGCRFIYYDLAADTSAIPAGATGEAGVIFVGNLGNQNSVGGQSVASCTTTNGSHTVTAPGGSFANVQKGMSVAGTGIPANTYVGSVVTGASDSLTLVQGDLATAQSATASGTVTLTFPGPYSLLEKWTASTAGVILNAQHLGNRAMGSITAAPTVKVSNGAVINLLGEIAGIVVSGTPSAGQQLVASGASGASWSGTRGSRKGLAHPTPGVSNSQGTPVPISMPSGAVGVLVIAFQWVPNGVSTEKIILAITATFDGNTTQTINASATGNASTQSGSGNQIVGLAKDGHYITGLSVSAASSAASTSATPSFTVVAVPVA